MQYLVLVAVLNFLADLPNERVSRSTNTDLLTRDVAKFTRLALGTDFLNDLIGVAVFNGLTL